MGPPNTRKGKGAKPSKGKSAAAAKAAEEKDLKKQEMRATLAFFRPGYNGEAVGKLQHAVASDFNEHGRTLIFPAGANVGSTDFWVFARFILTGLVPPFSLFLHALMESYQLRVAQLHPMSLYLLAIFSFLCEGFVGVMPSVALFRHYFYPRIDNKKAMSSGVVFRARDRMKSEFIVRSEKKIEKEWRSDWCWLRVDEPEEFIVAPTELPVEAPGWRDRYHRDANLLPIVERIKALRVAGLSDLDMDGSSSPGTPRRFSGVPSPRGRTRGPETGRASARRAWIGSRSRCG